MFLLRMPFYDVIFFQKVYSRWHCFLLRFANLLNKKTVFDLDDAPSRINNPVTLKNVEFMMRNVSAVTVGSQVLFDYVSKYSKNVHLIPSCIYLKYYQPTDRQRAEGQLVCLGWIGNGAHYKNDLISILREPLIEVVKRYPVRLKIIGACGERELYAAFKNIEGLELDFIDQIEWSNPRAVVNALEDIDIGLYPLLPNEFNQYKCGFKALEYMAMKIPVISSNVAENREIIAHDRDGLLVDSNEEWFGALNELILDKKKRENMGKAGRLKVTKEFNILHAASQIKSIITANN